MLREGQLHRLPDLLLLDVIAANVLHRQAVLLSSTCTCDVLLMPLQLEENPYIRCAMQG
jgi:hypothetical protein